MDKLTTERLERKIKNCIDIEDVQVMLPLSAAEELLAFREAAKNPVAIIENSEYMTAEQLAGEEPHKKAVKELYEGALVVGSKLYAAPVLPEQAELVENLKKVMNNWLAMEPKLAFQPEFTDVMMLLDAEPAPAQPVIPEGFTCDDGILTANLGAGDVLISNVNWPDSGHAGVAFAPVPQPKRENLADYTDVVSGKSTQDIGSVFVVKSSSVESLLVLREKVDAAIANFDAQPVIPERTGENLPCPFCGGEVDISGWRSSNGNTGPECNECGATACNLSEWNKRTAQPVSEFVQEMTYMTAAKRGIKTSNREQWIKGYNAAINDGMLLSPAQPVSEPYKLPSGWKLVPEEATIAMLTLLGLTGSFDFMQQKYKNMLAAAPAHTVSEHEPSYRDGLIAAAKWVEKQREAYDNEHGQHDSDTGFFEFGNDAQRDYSETLAEIAEGIRSLHPASAQPVIPEQAIGGFSIDDMKELHESLVKSHVSKALSGEKMKATVRNSDLAWIHGVIVQAAWFVLAHTEAAERQNVQQNIPENIPAQPVSEHKPYAWAIEHKVGLPTVVFNKPNTNSWAFKDAVIKELYEAPEQESE